MTVVLDEDVSRQITLTREGEVIIGVNPAPVLPYVDGRISQKLFKTPQVYIIYQMQGDDTKIIPLCNKNNDFIFDHGFGCLFLGV